MFALKNNSTIINVLVILSVFFIETAIYIEKKRTRVPFFNNKQSMHDYSIYAVSPAHLRVHISAEQPDVPYTLRVFPLPFSADSGPGDMNAWGTFPVRRDSVELVYLLFEDGQWPANGFAEIVTSQNERVHAEPLYFPAIRFVGIVDQVFSASPGSITVTWAARPVHAGGRYQYGASVYAVDASEQVIQYPSPVRVMSGTETGSFTFDNLQNGVVYQVQIDVALMYSDAIVAMQYSVPASQRIRTVGRLPAPHHVLVTERSANSALVQTSVMASELLVRAFEVLSKRSAESEIITSRAEFMQLSAIHGSGEVSGQTIIAGDFVAQGMVTHGGTVFATRALSLQNNVVSHASDQLVVWDSPVSEFAAVNPAQIVIVTIDMNAGAATYAGGGESMSVSIPYTRSGGDAFRDAVELQVVEYHSGEDDDHEPEPEMQIHRNEQDTMVTIVGGRPGVRYALNWVPLVFGVNVVTLNENIYQTFLAPFELQVAPPVLLFEDNYYISLRVPSTYANVAEPEVRSALKFRISCVQQEEEEHDHVSSTNQEVFSSEPLSRWEDIGDIFIGALDDNTVLADIEVFCTLDSLLQRCSGLDSVRRNSRIGFYASYQVTENAPMRGSSDNDSGEIVSGISENSIRLAPFLEPLDAIEVVPDNTAQQSVLVTVARTLDPATMGSNLYGPFKSAQARFLGVPDQSGDYAQTGEEARADRDAAAETLARALAETISLTNQDPVAAEIAAVTFRGFEFDESELEPRFGVQFQVQFSQSLESTLPNQVVILARRTLPENAAAENSLRLSQAARTHVVVAEPAELSVQLLQPRSIQIEPGTVHGSVRVTVEPGSSQQQVSEDEHYWTVSVFLATTGHLVTDATLGLFSDLVHGLPPGELVYCTATEVHTDTIRYIPSPESTNSNTARVAFDLSVLLRPSSHWIQLSGSTRNEIYIFIELHQLFAESQQHQEPLTLPLFTATGTVAATRLPDESRTIIASLTQTPLVHVITSGDGNDNNNTTTAARALFCIPNVAFASDYFNYGVNQFHAHFTLAAVQSAHFLHADVEFFVTLSWEHVLADISVRPRLLQLDVAPDTGLVTYTLQTPWPNLSGRTLRTINAAARNALNSGLPPALEDVADSESQVIAESFLPAEIRFTHVSTGQSIIVPAYGPGPQQFYWYDVVTAAFPLEEGPSEFRVHVRHVAAYWGFPPSASWELSQEEHEEAEMTVNIGPTVLPPPRNLVVQPVPGHANAVRVSWDIMSARRSSPHAMVFTVLTAAGTAVALGGDLETRVAPAGVSDFVAILCDEDNADLPFGARVAVSVQAISQEPGVQNSVIAESVEEVFPVYRPDARLISVAHTRGDIRQYGVTLRVRGLAACFPPEMLGSYVAAEISILRFSQRAWHGVVQDGLEISEEDQELSLRSLPLLLEQTDQLVLTLDAGERFVRVSVPSVFGELQSEFSEADGVRASAALATADGTLRNGAAFSATLAGKPDVLRIRNVVPLSAENVQFLDLSARGSSVLTGALSLCITFWLRVLDATIAAPDIQTIFYIDDGTLQNRARLEMINHNALAYTIETSDQSVQFSSSNGGEYLINFSDGEWHFVALTLGNSENQQLLEIDGVTTWSRTDPLALSVADMGNINTAIVGAQNVLRPAVRGAPDVLSNATHRFQFATNATLELDTALPLVQSMYLQARDRPVVQNEKAGRACLDCTALQYANNGLNSFLDFDNTYTAPSLKLANITFSFWVYGSHAAVTGPESVQTLLHFNKENAPAEVSVFCSSISTEASQLAVLLTADNYDTLQFAADIDILDDAWHHVAVCIGTTNKIYIDGADHTVFLIGDAENDFSMETDVASFTFCTFLGARNALAETATAPFRNYIADLVVFPTVLDPVDIQIIAAETEPVEEAVVLSNALSADISAIRVYTAVPPLTPEQRAILFADEATQIPGIVSPQTFTESSGSGGGEETENAPLTAPDVWRTAVLYPSRGFLANGAQYTDLLLGQPDVFTLTGASDPKQHIDFSRSVSTVSLVADSVSVSFWFRTNGSSGTLFYFAGANHQNHAYLEVLEDGRLSFVLSIVSPGGHSGFGGAEAFDSGPGFADDQWHFVVLTLSGGSSRMKQFLQIDSTIATDSAADTDTLAGLGSLTRILVGAREDTTPSITSAFTGYVAGFRLFAGDLTWQQRDAMYYYGAQVNPDARLPAVLVHPRAVLSSGVLAPAAGILRNEAVYHDELDGKQEVLALQGEEYMDLSAAAEGALTGLETASFSCWFRTTHDAAGSAGTVVYVGNAVQHARVDVLADGRVYFMLQSAPPPSELDAAEFISRRAGCNDGQWHFLALCVISLPPPYSAGQTRHIMQIDQHIERDAVMYNTASFADFSVAVDAVFVGAMGENPDASGASVLMQGFVGDIAEFRMYTTKLTAAQREALFFDAARLLPRTSPPPVAPVPEVTAEHVRARAAMITSDGLLRHGATYDASLLDKPAVVSFGASVTLWSPPPHIDFSDAFAAGAVSPLHTVSGTFWFAKENDDAQTATLLFLHSGDTVENRAGIDVLSNGRLRLYVDAVAEGGGAVYEQTESVGSGYNDGQWHFVSFSLVNHDGAFLRSLQVDDAAAVQETTGPLYSLAALGEPASIAGPLLGVAKTYVAPVRGIADVFAAASHRYPFFTSMTQDWTAGAEDLTYRAKVRPITRRESHLSRPCLDCTALQYALNGLNSFMDFGNTNTLSTVLLSSSVSFWVCGSHPGAQELHPQTILHFFTENEPGELSLYLSPESDDAPTRLVLHVVDHVGASLTVDATCAPESMTDLLDGTWHHVAARISGTDAEIKLYIDGVDRTTVVHENYDESFSFSPAAVSAEASFTYLSFLGARNALQSTASEPFRNYIADLSFFPSPLVPSDISILTAETATVLEDVPFTQAFRGKIADFRMYTSLFNAEDYTLLFQDTATSLDQLAPTAAEEEEEQQVPVVSASSRDAALNVWESALVSPGFGLLANGASYAATYLEKPEVFLLDNTVTDPPAAAQYVDFSRSVQRLSAAAAAISITCWFKTSSEGTILYLGAAAGTDSSLSVILNTSGVVRCTIVIAESTVQQFESTAGTNLADDAWHFLYMYVSNSASVETGGMSRLLEIDGVSVSQNTSSGLLSLVDIGTLHDIRVGATAVEDTLFTGAVSGLRIYGAFLDSTQRAAVQSYAAEISPFARVPLSWVDSEEVRALAGLYTGMGGLRNGASFAASLDGLPDAITLAGGGQNQYLDLSGALDGFDTTAAVSVSLWFRSSSDGSSGGSLLYITNADPPIAQSHARVGLQAAGKVAFELRAGGGSAYTQYSSSLASSGGNGFNDGNWHFLCLVIESNSGGGVQQHMLQVDNHVEYYSRTEEASFAALGSLTTALAGIGYVFQAATGVYAVTDTALHHFAFVDSIVANSSFGKADLDYVANGRDIITDTFKGRTCLNTMGLSRVSGFQQNSFLHFNSQLSTLLHPAISFSFWICGVNVDPAPVNSMQYLFYVKNNSGSNSVEIYTLNFGGNNMINVDLYSGGSRRLQMYTSASINLLDDEWHHIVVHFGGGSNRIYADGVHSSTTYALGSNEKTAFSMQNELGSAVASSLMGKLDGSSLTRVSGYVFRGYFADFTIYPRTLSEAEVSVLYSNTPGTPSSYSLTEDFAGNIADIRAYSQVLSTSQREALFYAGSTGGGGASSSSGAPAIVITESQVHATAVIYPSLGTLRNGAVLNNSVVAGKREVFTLSSATPEQHVDFVDSVNLITSPSSVSVTLWFRTSSAPATIVHFANAESPADQVTIRLLEGGSVEFRITVNEGVTQHAIVSASGGLADDEWHFVAASLVSTGSEQLQLLQVDSWEDSMNENTVGFQALGSISVATVGVHAIFTPGIAGASVVLNTAMHHYPLTTSRTQNIAESGIDLNYVQRNDKLFLSTYQGRACLDATSLKGPNSNPSNSYLTLEDSQVHSLRSLANITFSFWICGTHIGPTGSNSIMSIIQLSNVSSGAELRIYSISASVSRTRLHTVLESAGNSVTVNMNTDDADLVDILDNNWHHIVVQIGNAHCMYVDGVERCTFTQGHGAQPFSISANIPFASELTLLGRKTSTATTRSESYRRYLSDVSIYPRALSESEIAILYANEASTPDETVLSDAFAGDISGFRVYDAALGAAEREALRAEIV